MVERKIGGIFRAAAQISRIRDLEVDRDVVLGRTIHQIELEVALRVTVRVFGDFDARAHRSYADDWLPWVGRWIAAAIQWRHVHWRLAVGAVIIARVGREYEEVFNMTVERVKRDL